MALTRRSPGRMAPSSRLDPVCRMLCLALLSSASLLASWPLALILACGSSILLALEGLPPWKIARESSFVLVFALLAAALRLLGSDAGGWDVRAFSSEAGLYCLKLLDAFLFGRLFYAATSLSQLRDACTRIARRVPFLRRFDLGLPLSLVLGYVPLILEEWRLSLEAVRSRGMSSRPSLAAQLDFLSAFLRRLMLRAVALPEALLARGWSRDRGVEDASWGIKDGVAIGISLGCLAIALLLIV